MFSPLCPNQFFVLDVYNSDRTPLTADQLCAQLEKICNASQQADEEPVGILTTQHRDSWGKVYGKLISGEPVRRIFVVAHLISASEINCQTKDYQVSYTDF